MYCRTAYGEAYGKLSHFQVTYGEVSCFGELISDFLV